MSENFTERIVRRGIGYKPMLPKPWFRQWEGSGPPSGVMCVFCGQVFAQGETYIMIDGRSLGACAAGDCGGGSGILGKLSEAGREDVWIRIHDQSRIVEKPLSQRLRMRIFKRDGYACLRCGSVDNLTIDHISPQFSGRNDAESNLQTLCKVCNSWKGKKTISYLHDPAQ